jgi:hypothetical protein
MPFQTDTQTPTVFGDLYGEYIESFLSEHGQVRADIFRQGQWLVARVSFPTGLRPYEVTDRYVSELHAFARQRGFDDRLRLIYA